MSPAALHCAALQDNLGNTVLHVLMQQALRRTSNQYVETWVAAGADARCVHRRLPPSLRFLSRQFCAAGIALAVVPSSASWPACPSVCPSTRLPARSMRNNEGLLPSEAAEERWEILDLLTTMRKAEARALRCMLRREAEQQLEAEQQPEAEAAPAGQQQQQQQPEADSPGDCAPQRLAQPCCSPRQPMHRGAMVCGRRQLARMSLAQLWQAAQARQPSGSGCCPSGATAGTARSR